MSVSVNSPGNGRQFLSLLQGALDSPTPRLPGSLSLCFNKPLTTGIPYAPSEQE